jgi:iron(III) transport system permease protein
MAIPIHRQTSAPPLSTRRCHLGQTPSRQWLGVWRGNPPSWDLLLAALLAVMLFTAPIGYVFLRAIQAGLDRWQVLLRTRVPVLLGNTLLLMGTVTAGAIVIGVTCAFLIERTDLPGRRVLQTLLAMPLIIPPYVGALTAIIILGPTGLLRDLLGRAPIRIYSFGGVAALLILFTYPYIYLMTAAALRRLNRSFEEAARSCGLSYHRVLMRVILPMLRPAIGAGAVLVALYVLSDFGLVSLMRYDTFTRAIYFQMTGRFDRSGAAVLSTLLIIITLGVLWFEIKTRTGKGYAQTVGTYRPSQRVPLGKLKLPALGFVLLILLCSVILPIGVLLYWGAQGVSRGFLNADLVRYLTNSLRIAAPTAVIAMVLAVPVAYLRSRHPSSISRGVDRIISAGYALPGVIVALGIIFLFNRYLPWLYATPGMIVAACLMRFLPQSLRSADASLELVAPRLDEAARGMGVRTGLVLWKVILPIILPGVLAGGALVFVSTMKELPATLLLRPAGLDTLAVRIWMEAHEGFYAAAALPALLLVLSSALPLSWMIRRY